MQNTSYVTRHCAISAVKKMMVFHEDLKQVFNKHSLNLLTDLGRRNILLSNAQEKYFASELSKLYTAKNDGRTGEPDILIEDLNKELECKLTSKHKSGAIVFQTDYETLEKKVKLDYLYVVANREFSEFAVIHYTDLTIDDFRNPSSGSRGKSQLLKHAAHDRAHVVVGEMVDLNCENIAKIEDRLSKTKNQSSLKYSKLINSLAYWKNCDTKFSVRLEKI